MQQDNKLLLPKNAKQLFIKGPVGNLDCLILNPSSSDIKGIAIIFHPDPKGGGTYTNKIVQTLARTLNEKGYICYCPNLRGVGLSEGTHDYGVGEIEDALSIHKYIRELYPNLPLVLAGFSFGCAIASGLAKQVEHNKLVLIAPAVSRYQVYVPDVTKTIVIHGQHDEVISIDEVFKWGEQNNQSIIWFPDTGHFFHGKLIALQNLLNNFQFQF